MSILPLRLREVSFAVRPGGKPLLKDVNLAIEAGGRTIVLGANGAGKSLMLRVCHGLIAPTKGEVAWQKPDAGLKQAMVFQRPVMLRRSVIANVEYPLKLRGMARAERRERAIEMLARVGLSRFASHAAWVLSGGEQQRLALARAWGIAPEVLFLDEPTASLDPASTHVIEDVIAAMHDEGTTIVMTTHDLGQARRLADRVLFMHRGRILEDAPAERFFAEPRNDLARSFLKGELLWWRKHELTPKD